MRYLILALLLVTTAILCAQEFKITTPDGSVSMSITGVENGKTTSGNIIDQIGKKLDQLEKEIHSKLVKLDQKKAEKIMDEVYTLLAMLPADGTVNVSQSTSTTASSSSITSSGTVNVNLNIGGTVTEQKPAPAPKPEPKKEEKPKPEPPKETKPARKLMAEADFGSLLGKIKAESFGDDKLRVLRTAAKNSKFNCSQIIRLIGAFTYSEEKLEALRISYPECLDPENNYKIMDAFTFSNDKEEAEGIINQ